MTIVTNAESAWVVVALAAAFTVCFVVVIMERGNRP